MTELEYTTNRFDGVVVDPSCLPAAAQDFGACLQTSLAGWRDLGLRLVWLELPIAKASLVPAAVEAGFAYHHAAPDYVMLTLPLCDDAFVPAHATHYVGAGGVVLNPERELLVVAERYHHAPGQPPRYKLPGGALHDHEHLVDGVIREVREETRIETRFAGLVCFRHWHDYRFGKSDIYFVCRLQPLSRTIVRQEAEIADCRWMPVDEYLQRANVSPFNRRVVEAALRAPLLGVEQIDGYEDTRRYEIFLPGLPAADQEPGAAGATCRAPG